MNFSCSATGALGAGSGEAVEPGVAVLDVVGAAVVDGEPPLDVGADPQLTTRVSRQTTDADFHSIDHTSRGQVLIVPHRSAKWAITNR
ncbi:hypothetical protein [Saccharothrix sp. NRRL B-16314]|uniref:hypothetical protein n=1 Tax=Saccharothrix sp. NRRL B-16314 TaxID=1463825 RepID=UPI001E64DEC3|nr:hypothetical protein [Saccharothrix sp. NRRL B-16314]